MSRRRFFFFGSSNGHARRPKLIPYNPVHKARCPECRSLATLYIPAIAEGHCDECGASWRFLADPEAGFERPTIRPKRIDYRDLVGFCVAMQRTKVRRLDEAIDRFRKLGIVEPERETFERAWKEAKDFA